MKRYEAERWAIEDGMGVRYKTWTTYIKWDGSVYRTSEGLYWGKGLSEIVGTDELNPIDGWEVTLP